MTRIPFTRQTGTTREPTDGMCTTSWIGRRCRRCRRRPWNLASQWRSAKARRSDPRSHPPSAPFRPAPPPSNQGRTNPLHSTPQPRTPALIPLPPDQGPARGPSAQGNRDRARDRGPRHRPPSLRGSRAPGPGAHPAVHPHIKHFSAVRLGGPSRNVAARGLSLRYGGEREPGRRAVPLDASRVGGWCARWRRSAAAADRPIDRGRDAVMELCGRVAEGRERGPGSPGRGGSRHVRPAAEPRRPARAGPVPREPATS